MPGDRAASHASVSPIVPESARNVNPAPIAFAESVFTKPGASSFSGTHGGIAYAQFHSGLLHLWMGNAEIAEGRGREVVEVAEEHQFEVWAAVGSVLRGAALVQLGSADDGLALIDQGMNVYRGLKTAPVFWPTLLHLHAEAYGAVSRPADGLPLLNQAIELASANLGKALASEFLVLRGELLLALSPDNAAEAESWF